MFMMIMKTNMWNERIFFLCMAAIISADHSTECLLFDWSTINK